MTCLHSHYTHHPCFYPFHHHYTIHYHLNTPTHAHFKYFSKLLSFEKKAHFLHSSYHIDTKYIFTIIIIIIIIITIIIISNSFSKKKILTNANVKQERIILSCVKPVHK